MRALFSVIVSTALFAGLSQAEPLDAPVVEMGRSGVSNLIAQMEKERKAHVAFLGGSITENAKGHSKMVADWLLAEWPDVDFTFTNAGLSSTCSLSGAGRVDRDVLSQGQVDLLVLEFAVNDDQDAGHNRKTAIRGLEGIIRQYYQANPTGSIISVQYVNPEILENVQQGIETVSVAAHKSVARHYGLPIVDVGQGLANEIAAGKMTWKENYGGTHPNQEGYQFASDLISSVIEKTVSGETPQTVALPDPLDEGSYATMTIVDPQSLNWLGGWKHAKVSKELLSMGQIRSHYEKYRAIRSDSAGDHLYYSFAGEMLGAFVLAGPDAGALEVSIDNGEWKKVELYHGYSGGLNYPRSVILADDLNSAYHQVAIRTVASDNEKSKGATATILYFVTN